ncbi:MAG: hypothetical protein ACYS1A_16255 [Planctomycetota bacterium]|jgi:hypothetical protein
MTGGKLHTKTDGRRCLLYMPQLFFFTSAIILLSALNFSRSSVEIKRPAILLAASVFSLFNFEKNSRFSVIAKIILLYIIEMFFNQLSGRLVHIRSFSIHLSLIAMVPMAVSFICSRLQKSQIVSVDTNNLLKSWVVVFTVIILHMLFLFPLLSNIYGYGCGHNFAVLANMCMYFLVFILSWEQLENISLRRITAIVSVVFFVVIMVRGF